MSKKVAVILSGCGVFDGSEIYESVLTILRLDQQGAQVSFFAPDIEQARVVNHLTNEEMPEKRNVLVEAARITRGQIRNVTELSGKDFDAVILPGGFGAATNLSDFASQSANCQIEPDTLAALNSFKQANKPIGLICIAPALSARIFGDGVQCTIGTDSQTAEVLNRMGATHQDCGVNSIVVDEKNLLVTTPAFMLANSISEAASGINALVDKILELAQTDP